AEKAGQSIVAAGERIGLSVTVKAQTGGGPRRAGRPFQLRVSAMDQPGIVHRITHLLHQQDVNIEELETHLEAGAYSGTPLFTMTLSMTVPPQTPVKTLRQELENLCDSLNCDMDLRASGG
ncbi:MAG: hypothetical protein IT440_13380, partial [Phycisphaeraceae bacterium]|nr:hypothetical protein [Phycisphaeraceae bacterium]